MPEWNETDDYYLNDDGFVVLTAKYLHERGYCCGSGCKNCPFEFENVPEPSRSLLLEDRIEKNYTIR